MLVPSSTKVRSAIRGRSTPIALIAAAAALSVMAGLVCARVVGGADGDSAWSPAERAQLASMSLDRLPQPPKDASNAVADMPAAAALGQQLFADARLSRNGSISCASCHAPERHFQDDRPVGQGIGTGKRRTMPIPGAAHSPWLFWDGRKDSLWSQALGPLEDGAEHGSNRTFLVQRLQAHYRQGYEAVFGPFPPLLGLPENAGPAGTNAERQAWERMPETQRQAVNQVFANLGKAIAAYERMLAFEPSRFDRYVSAVQANDDAGQKILSRDEIAGLRLFIGKAGCATCHNGPLFSDQHFHNTGVPARDAGQPDRGRAAALARAVGDEFNCLGRYSDAPADACSELRFIADADPAMEGAFKTPSLRNVAERPPYMHAGQLATLEAVVSHYRAAPKAAIGKSELVAARAATGLREPIKLSEDEARQVVAFLRSLSGPVSQDSKAGLRR